MHEWSWPMEVKALLLDAYDAEHHLTLGPGSLSCYDLYQIDGPPWSGEPIRVGFDVVCPGCGQKVYHLVPDRYPIDRQTLHGIGGWTVTFVPCCGSTWRLDNGRWIRTYVAQPKDQDSDTG